MNKEKLDKICDNFVKMKSPILVLAEMFGNQVANNYVSKDANISKITSSSTPVGFFTPNKDKAMIFDTPRKVHVVAKKIYENSSKKVIVYPFIRKSDGEEFSLLTGKKKEAT